MEELQAKWTFDQGGFAKALIVPTPMGQGYHLHLVKFGKMSETIVLERQRGGWRVFKRGHLRKRKKSYGKPLAWSSFSQTIVFERLQ